MLKVVGNLSEKGMSFFLDPELKYEIGQNQEIDIEHGTEVDIYIGVKHRYENGARYGKILSLEENYFSFMVDMIEEVQGNSFRNYDNIESISFKIEFDVKRFLKNMLIGMMNKQFYHVLEFLTRPHMSPYHLRESFETCACEPERRTEIDCKTTCGKYIPVWKWKPSGWWGTNEWPPGGYYNFYTDFFLEAGEDRTSIFEQWAYNRDVTRIMINRYLDKGYPSYSDAHKCFNYINNIYPEQSSIMDYRWKYGGYDVTWFEYRINKTYVYQTFSSWYTGVVPETTKEVFFVADEQTVKGFTDIAKTNTRAIFERDEHILEELLGPKHCISWNYQGECTSFGYGDFLTEEEIYIIWGDGSGVDELIDDLWPEGELSEHHFVVHYNPSFESMSEQYINSSTYRDLCFGMHGVNPSSAFYSVEHSDGKIGGQYIYNNGLGNEHRYFMQFSEFLREQGWTLDDFMNIYSAQVDDRCNELILAATKNTPVKASNFSEFYDKNHKAPFDGIEYYIPMIPILDEDESDLNNMVRVEKKKIIVDQNGVESISDVDDEIVLPGDFTSSINKDEFISSVTANGSLRVFISNYMRIKMSIKFNSEYATTQVVKLRVSTSDLTYLNEREFKYYE